MTKADVEAFLDGLMPQQIEREDIAGAVVTIVKDGNVLFAKGYGYADFAKKKSVSPEETLFRPGSISKLFTWTSVMQQVEQGKLDLDQDVNKYIDFKIPATFSKPITIRNLMTHSPGLEESIKDLFTLDPSGSFPLKTYLPSHLPERIFPPGETPAYSNYGTALAGYIVERSSGKPLTKYIEDSIFIPLGMSHSTFEQPLPERLKKFMSNGYKLGSKESYPFEVITAFPAGSLSASGMDMTRFMIAHLQNGQFGNQRILKEDTAKLMHSRQLGLDPNTSGMCLGFYEESRNGLRIIGHGGDTVYFHSDLHLIPEKNLGFFVSYNSGGKGEVSGRTIVWEKFLDRYFPYPTNPETMKTGKTANSDAVKGTYLISRRSQSNLLWMVYLLLESTVSVGKDGNILSSDFKDTRGNPKEFREIKPLVFQEVGGQDLVVFHKTGSGYRMITDYPFFVWDRVPWYQNSHFIQSMFGFSIGIFLLTLIFWPINALVRRHYGKTLNLTGSERRLRLISRLVCLIAVAFIGGLAFFLINGFENVSGFSSKNDIWVHLLQIVGLVGLLGTLVCFAYAFRTWANRERGIWTKIHALLLLLACIGFVWIVLQGNLVDMNLHY